MQWRIMVERVEDGGRTCPRWRRLLRCGQAEDTTPPVGSLQVSLSRPKVALGSPVEVTYKFTVRRRAASFGPAPRVRALSRRRRRVDVDRRSRSADADDRMEARADHRVHAIDVRSRAIPTSAPRRSSPACIRRRTTIASSCRTRIAAIARTRSSISSCCRRPRTSS